MDAFKRALLLTAKAELGQITSDELRKELLALIPQMQADPESQLAPAGDPQGNPPASNPPAGY